MCDRVHFSCERNLLNLSDVEQSRAREKLKKLSESMQILEYKYAIRDDSRLAYNYCVGKLNWKELEVMEELCVIQWLSEATDYQALCEILIRSVAERFKTMYGIGNWSLIYEIVRSYVPDILKQHIVDEMGLPEMKKIRWGDD